MDKEPRKKYSKPELVRYGTVQELTSSGHPGTSMDSLKRQNKTGF